MALDHEGPLSSESEQVLMRQLVAGDDDAVRALYGRFGRSVYTLGVRLLGSNESAEELTQDVFVAAWRKADRFDAARGRLSTWLMAIAHNMAIDRLHLSIGGLTVFERGAGVEVDLDGVRRIFEQPEIEIVAGLGMGEGTAEAWGCDLSEEYVRINAEYTT